MNKKLFLLIILIIVFLSYFGVKKISVPKKTKMSSDYSEQFLIDKIYYYSSANAINNNTTYQNPEWNLDLYQYTDIGIYLNRLENNYINNIYIDNINIKNNLNKDCKLYYLNPTEFGDYNIKEENLISETLTYNILNSSNEKNDLNYSIPIFFEDCSNPITLKYVNTVKKNYIVNSEEKLSYDGTLLKSAGLTINNLKTNIELDLNIITNNNENHKVTLNLDIPFQTSSKNIFDGSVEFEQKNINVRF